MEYQVEQIKELMIKNEITQKEVSRVSKIDKKNVSDIMKGKTDPRLKTFNKIVDAVIELSI